MSTIAENLAGLRGRIARFEAKYAREPGAVQLIAVSKTRASDEIAAAVTAGQQDFGENYLQEARRKQEELEGAGIRWHFIGPVQSNKTREIAAHFAWVHSVDRAKVARRLGEQRPAGLPPINILLQVNLSGEASKAGASLEEVETLAAQVAGMDGIRLKGLMAIPAPEADFQAQRATFRRLARARDALLDKGLSDCRELSMGMSGDFEAAIAEGATMVRIGTGLFGPRR